MTRLTCSAAIRTVIGGLPCAVTAQTGRPMTIRDLITAVRRNGVPSEMLVSPDEGHWVLKALNSQRWHETVLAWMKRYL